MADSTSNVALAIDCLRRRDPDVGSLYMARMQYLTSEVRGAMTNALARLALLCTDHGSGVVGNQAILHMSEPPTGKKYDLEKATDQVCRALAEEGWIA